MNIIVKRPCWRCQSGRHETIEPTVYQENGYYRVQCDDCGLRSNVHETMYDALIDWNEGYDFVNQEDD